MRLALILILAALILGVWSALTTPYDGRFIVACGLLAAAGARVWVCAPREDH